jgi:hypothetical protein
LTKEQGECGEKQLIERRLLEQRKKLVQKLILK